MYETTISFESRDDVRVVFVRSEIDLANAPIVRRYLADAARDTAALVVSLEGCTFIDSSGLALLLEAAAAFGRRFALVAQVGSFPRRVVELAALAARLRLCPSLDAALANCKRGMVAA